MMLDRTIGQLNRVMGIGLFLLVASCLHAPIIFHGSDYTVYQSGRVHVYLAAEFPAFLMGESPQAARRFYEQTLDEIGILFKRKILTGEMFFKALGEQPASIGVRNLVNYSPTRIDEILAADPGPLLKLLNCQNISDPNDPKHRRYDLWVTFTPEETGLGAFHHFTLLLENPAATDKTPAKNFSEKARVESLTYMGMEF